MSGLQGGNAIEQLPEVGIVLDVLIGWSRPLA